VGSKLYSEPLVAGYWLLSNLNYKNPALYTLGSEERKKYKELSQRLKKYFLGTRVYDNFFSILPRVALLLEHLVLSQFLTRY